jgi:hypothetical protein
LNNGLALEACIPYTSGDGSEPPCPTTCVNGSAIVRTKATKVYAIPYESLLLLLTIIIIIIIIIIIRDAR